MGSSDRLIITTTNYLSEGLALEIKWLVWRENLKVKGVLGRRNIEVAISLKVVGNHARLKIRNK